MPSSPAAPRFAALADKYWDARMRWAPFRATLIGYPRYHDRLEANTPAGRREQSRQFAALKEELLRIPREGLPEARRPDWDAMRFELDILLEFDRHRLWQWAVQHLDGPQTKFASVIELAQPMRTEDDAKALLRRMDAFPDFFAAEIGNLREGQAQRRTAPRVAVSRAIDQLEAILRTPAAQSPFLPAAARLPARLRARWAARIEKAVLGRVYPAYARYLEFLREYLPHARAARAGLCELPGGEAAYRYLIRRHTTLDASAESLHRRGHEELAKIGDEMAAIIRRKGFRGDLRAFFERVRRDPGNFFSSRREIVRTAERLVARTYKRLPRYFGALPRTGLVVKPIEEYKEKDDVGARYYAPPDDLSRPGVYYVNTYKPETRPRLSAASLAVHEGVPGHHLQLAVAIERRGLPAFRRHASFTAFIEGWALYSERLADEMGIFRDDDERLGMLDAQAFRAARLVVDTGLHAMGWTREKAVEFMKEHTSLSEHEIVSEVDRYLIWPGQALAYMTGKLELCALREECRRREGARFDIRRFHDAVLTGGALPLPALRAALLA